MLIRTLAIRTLAITGTITALFASSAMAQSYQPEVGSGNIVSENRQPGGASAFAYEPPRHLMYHHRMYHGTTSAPGASINKDDTR